MSRGECLHQDRNGDLPLYVICYWNERSEERTGTCRCVLCSPCQGRSGRQSGCWARKQGQGRKDRGEWVKPAASGGEVDLGPGHVALSPSDHMRGSRATAQCLYVRGSYAHTGHALGQVVVGNAQGDSKCNEQQEEK